MRLTIFLLSALAMASVVLAQEREEKAPTISPRPSQLPPSSSLEAVVQGLDETNEKLDTNHQAILAVAGQLHDFAAGGATHWISPYWKSYDLSLDNVFGLEHYVTKVYLVNTSFKFTADLSINVYDDDGDLDAERSSHRKIPPRGMRRYKLKQGKDLLDEGWLEVVSDRKVFVAGEILIERFEGGKRIKASRTTTWYRADSQ